MNVLNRKCETEAMRYRPLMERSVRMREKQTLNKKKIVIELLLVRFQAVCTGVHFSLSFVRFCHVLLKCVLLNGPFPHFKVFAARSCRLALLPLQQSASQTPFLRSVVENLRTAVKLNQLL